jgi:hypothetical protein
LFCASPSFDSDANGSYRGSNKSLASQDWALIIEILKCEDLLCFDIRLFAVDAIWHSPQPALEDIFKNVSSNGLKSQLNPVDDPCGDSKSIPIIFSFRCPKRNKSDGAKSSEYGG